MLYVDLNTNTQNSEQAPAFQTIDFLTLLSGVSAVNTEGGVQTSNIFNFNGVSYNQSTGGILPAVNDSKYDGSSNLPSDSGIYFSGGEVLVNSSINWDHYSRESNFQGTAKNYTVIQQGFSANVSCQGIDRSTDSFSVTSNPTTAQGANYTYLAWEAIVNCSGNANTQTFITLGNATGQLDTTLGFLPAVVCPSPSSPSFNPNKFEIFMAGLGKYTFLPTTVCEVVPYLTTVNVTYNEGIISVNQVGVSSDLAINSNLPLSQYIASVMNYQAGANQAPTKNTIGDFLAAYGTGDSTLYSELEEYWRGIAEFSATQLRSGYSASGKYSPNEIPSNMSTSTTGTMYITTYGWQSHFRTYIFVLVVMTMIWGATVWAATYSLIRRKYSPDSYFDFSDPLHLIVAASAGGLEEPLMRLRTMEEYENLEVMFVDAEGGLRKKKLVSVEAPQAPPQAL